MVGPTMDVQVSACQSRLPSSVLRAETLPMASPWNRRPAAVATTPPFQGCSWRTAQTVSPLSGSKATV